MKKILSVLSLFLIILFCGCFEIVQESEIHEDGSGVFSNTTDFSSMLGILSIMGGEETKKMDKVAKDTTISLSNFKDSIADLNDKEKLLLENATLNIVLNIHDEKFFLTFNFPYSQPSDINLIKNILKKKIQKAIAQQLESLIPGDDAAGNPMAMGKENENYIPEIDEYFDIITENGKLGKKLNKERYIDAENDKSLKSLREMSQMGTPMTMKVVFNLPKPATKAEGKGVKLSSDKKKVIIEATIDDFFDDPSKFEYQIEY